MLEQLPYDDVDILVVDDDASTRRLLVQILEKIGAKKVYVASDGGEGLLMAHNHIPDLIISDIEMRPIDGVSFLGGLRNSTNTQVSGIPVVMFTSDSDGATIKKSKELGIDGYIVKPFNPRGFAKYVTDVIAKHHKPISGGGGSSPAPAAAPAPASAEETLATDGAVEEAPSE